uniref:MFS domain-containing protein n=2 Tax=Ascaris TaxID=6251 RepID=A0A0M3I9B1_ASCLU
MKLEPIKIPLPSSPVITEARWLPWEAGLGSAVWLCAFANFINSADRVIMPIAIGALSADHEYTLVQQGWVLSAFPAGYISSQIIGSCAGSQLGGRRLLLSVVLLWSLSTLLTPIVASSFHLLIFARVVLGLGEGLGLPTMYHILAEGAPPRQRSSAFAYLAAAGSVGQTIASLVCPHFPWEICFYVFGILGLYWCVLWLRSSVGLKPPSTSDQMLLCQKMRHQLRAWDRFICSSPLLAIYFAHFCMNWTAYVIMHWLPTYLRVTFHADPTGISLAALPYLANSLFAIGTGHLVDSVVNAHRMSLRRARVTATVLGLILPAIFLVAFAFVRSLYLAILMVSLSMGALALNSAGHLSNHADVAPKYAGITFAISNTIATLPGLTVGPLTARLVVESSGRWWPSFVLASALNLVGAMVYANYAVTKQVI